MESESSECGLGTGIFQQFLWTRGFENHFPKIWKVMIQSNLTPKQMCVMKCDKDFPQQNHFDSTLGTIKYQILWQIFVFLAFYFVFSGQSRCLACLPGNPTRGLGAGMLWTDSRSWRPIYEAEKIGSWTITSFWRLCGQLSFRLWGSEFSNKELKTNVILRHCSNSSRVRSIDLSTMMPG